MKLSTDIRLVPSSNHDKDYLLQQLMTDFFYTLGYDDVRLNIPQTRNGIVYLQGQHRSKSLWLRAECRVRATKRELKNFITGLNREYAKRHKEGIEAYFVFLGGFPQQNLVEDEQINLHNVNLVASNEVIESLETGLLLVKDEETIVLANKCLESSGLSNLVLQRSELLVHETGYIKAVYYGQHKQYTHFALIHADGSVLAEPVARKLIEDDKLTRGHKQLLRYLPLPAFTNDNLVIAEQALNHYRRWLGEECGSIQLDGLPTDSDLGPRKLELERLFVPLNVVYIKRVGEPQEITEEMNEQVPIGQLLTKAAHIAILASPGGGKSTLLKRLATAYAFPERRQEIDDNLPAHDWLPLFMRCRELQDKVRLPILAILEDIPNRVGMEEKEAQAFRRFMHTSLQEGRILLLVDGLDEISHEKDRITFANNLRSFLAVYPQIALVVTSREAGFRLVAGTIASVCLYTRLATFSEKDIQDLSVRWLTEVEMDTPQVRQGAIKLAEDIWESERIRALAVNPLLLTTLLVVKRWIGELPRNRAALYGVAVQVLVRTWNVEGYEPLDEQETLAQLSFVACAMMEQGIQQISYNALLKLLNEARQELEAELQFTRVSPAMFIERVESRSSLLMQTGRVLENDELQPVYEFRHLTFQEYAAARGYAKEQHPQRNEELSLVELLSPHFADERWREVIPLAVVMAERKATEATVKALINLSEFKDTENIEQDSPYLHLLLSCILDEVKLTSNTLTAALKVIAPHSWTNNLPNQTLLKLKNSKVGDLFYSIVENEFASGIGAWETYGVAYGYLCEQPMNYNNNEQMTSFIANISASLLSQDKIMRIRAAMQLMQFCFRIARPSITDPVLDINGNPFIDKLPIKFEPEEVVNLYAGLNNLLHEADWPAAFAASWALAWAGTAAFHQHEANMQSIKLLLNLWRHAPRQNIADFIAWGLAECPLLTRDTLTTYLQDEGWDIFLKNIHQIGKDYARSNAVGRAVAITAWYRYSPWSDEALAIIVENAFSFNERVSSRTMHDQEKAYIILATLGDLGNEVMQKQKEFVQNQIDERLQKAQHRDAKIKRVSPG